MSAGALTSLTAVKQFLKIDPSNTVADDLLGRMIRRASAFTLNCLNRETLTLTEYNEVYDGYGNSFMMLRHNPVFDIAALSSSGSPMTAATGDGFTSQFTNGFRLEPAYSAGVGTQRLNLYGYAFPRGRGAVSVRYRSGFVTTETHTIPGSPYTVTPDYFWLADVSVADPTGALFTKVASAPSTGEYAVSADGVYTFASADADKEVVITYSYVPADIEEAVISIVAERYNYMDRVGVLSKALGGQETVSFSQKSMPDATRETLVPYINVVPI